MKTIIHKIHQTCKVWGYHINQWVSKSLGMLPEERLREGSRAVIVVATSLLAFGLGSLYSAQNTPHTLSLDTTHAVPYIVNNAALEASGTMSQGKVKGVSIVAPNGKTIVASKKGKKYHYIWCSGAGRISAKNRRYFSTAEEAKNAGYTLASNCEAVK
jgi:hypothetical protein